MEIKRRRSQPSGKGLADWFTGTMRIAILAGIFISVFSIATISEAQTMKKEGLKAKQEKIVTIAAFTANGYLQKLKTALNEGLDAGLTINEIKEILVQLYAMRISLQPERHQYLYGRPETRI
ncbi:MAG TPA: carboxymuconolactone decarboxylase family protein [Thermodesulfovibrionales bacterium]|jgi:alkylhydroperoxidase/carboxymuconolactone decarboxylase family protein YurZ|nr:carboxymuconolactone decarboxylase family protein [Thermodesulfovibrionales bacterium]